MPNDVALRLNDIMEKVETNLDTFIMMAEMGMTDKEAMLAMQHEADELRRCLADFNNGISDKDGMAKMATASVYNSAHEFENLLSNSMNPSAIALKAKELKIAMASARRTYLSRDSLTRMSIR